MARLGTTKRSGTAATGQPAALNARQAAVLRCIAAHYQRYQTAPTIREIQAALGISSTSVVFHHLNRMVKLGYLVKRYPGSRSVALLPLGYAAIGELAPATRHTDGRTLAAENRWLRQWAAQLLQERVLLLSYLTGLDRKAG